MKFTDGYWMDRDGMTVNHPQEVYDFQVDEQAVTLYAPYKKVAERGDTLNIGMTTLTITSPQSDIIGVQLTHFDQIAQGPRFAIDDQQKKLKTSVVDQCLAIKSGDLTVKVPVGHQPFNLVFEANGQVLTTSENGAQGQIVDTKHHESYMREQLSLDIDTLVYGLGERFTPFVKNGQVVNTWNADGGTGSEQSYKNIPFYITNQGYGVFVNQSENVSYEVASENVSRVQFSVPGESLEYYVIYGATPKEILKKYTDLTGKPALPPAWSFGLWLSTSFTTDYSEKTVMKFIDGMQERDIPLDVFHFDCFWMKGFEWTNFEWDRQKFPDPEGMLRRIHEKGVKVCVWLNPYIGQKSRLFKIGQEKGYFIKRQDGNVWQWDMWQAGQGIVDFTNPQAVEWYKGYLRELMDMGVDSFKTDFGERIPTEDVVYYDGSSPEKMHNYYTYLYNQTVFEVLQEKKGLNEAVLFARSATVGSQKFPVHWGGDNLSRYASMADSLRGGLSFLLSGFGFWSHDIGGFEDNATADIYKRWTQFGLLSSHSRYHGNIEYRVPWNYDDEAVAVTRKFVKNKLAMMPYLFSEAVQTHQTGVPLMRPVFLEFDQDQNVGHLATQYMLGSQLMVAPIFNDQGTVKYYLPNGVWTNLLTHQVYDVPENGQWLQEKYDYLNLPLLARQNTILLQDPTATHAEYDYTQAPEIHLFQMTAGQHQQTVVDCHGNQVGFVTVTVSVDGHELSVDAQCLKTLPKLIYYQGMTIKEISMTTSCESFTLK
ncbi:alpha-xylosidase [Latilactobacillus fuchuensis]|uniref:alpha-D-xyloside xylohydrolase n=2 Tax=Latilactobacillus fuchuensis TaxID=164393 RepID=A0A2N9DY10_9LACO|nr:alpha-xylosidase [Latilactobacillus fuchuensis]KRL60976.1 alpha-xylosidase [Latilactobacillus fuchuensis DSM 14340 = JCM 11249]SPC39717.1 putative alpha-glucosidase [Latilactobacillus fuchuensis]